MKEFENLIDDDEFKQFVFNDYFCDTDMTEEQKLSEVTSSLYDYAEAMTSYKLKNNGRSEH